jgi:hypothetical protein
VNVKELSYLIFALLASSCVGYGAMAIARRIIGGFEGKFTPFVGVLVGSAPWRSRLAASPPFRRNASASFFSRRA